MTLGERCDEIIRLIDQAVGSDPLPASGPPRSVDEPVRRTPGFGPGTGSGVTAQEVSR
jgi:hypothetical protein